MALALSDLFKAETRDEVFSSILTVAGDVALKVTAWQEGQPFRALLTYVSQKISDTTELTAEAIRGGLLEYATKGWLTLLARSVYRVERDLAKAAQGGAFRFDNAGADEQVIAPGDLVVAHSVSGKTYTNIAEVTIPAGGFVDDVVMLASEAGTESDAGPGMVTEMVSAIVGVTCTNEEALLGRDEELDEPLRVRCRNKLGSLSPNGPKEAYSYVATTPYFPDGTACAPTSVAITRTLPVADELTGILTLYIATATGAPSAPDVAIVDAAIDRWATPWCTTSSAVAAAEVVVPVTYQLWISGSSLTSLQVQAQVAVAIAAYFASVPISGYKIPPDDLGKLYVEAIRTAIAKATTGIIKVAVTLPAGDLELAVGQVAKLGAITPTITVVA